ncbi:MAG: hypothetical protein ACI37Z_05070 [Candidatus Gastranaerophilaceae bacterium]
MSYYITQQKSKFTIKKENILPCLNAFNKEFNKNFTDIAEVFDEQGFDVHSCDAFNISPIENSGISRIEFMSENYGEIDGFFNTIAPYVEKNSFIEFAGEDGRYFRFFFDGKQVIEEDAIITFSHDDPNQIGGYSRDEGLFITVLKFAALSQKPEYKILNELDITKKAELCSLVWDLWIQGNWNEQILFPDFAEKILKKYTKALFPKNKKRKLTKGKNMRLYYTLSNLTDIRDVLIHDIILTDKNDNFIVISAIEPEGNDESGRWKGIQINGIENDKHTISTIKNAIKCGHEITNCTATAIWENHAEITLEAEIVIKNSDDSIKERINLTPKPVTIEFDE